MIHDPVWNIENMSWYCVNCEAKLATQLEIIAASQTKREALSHWNHHRNSRYNSDSYRLEAKENFTKVLCDIGIPDYQPSVVKVHQGYECKPKGS